jgi:hypothetical protein
MLVTYGITFWQIDTKIWATALVELIYAFGLERTNTVDYTLTMTHTDNVLGASSDTSESQHIVCEFKLKWELKEVDINFLIGLIVCTSADRLISIDQAQYFEKALKHFSLFNLDPISTPLPFNCQISVNIGPLTPADADFMQDKWMPLYQEDQNVPDNFQLHSTIESQNLLWETVTALGSVTCSSESFVPRMKTIQN